MCTTVHTWQWLVLLNAGSWSLRWRWFYFLDTNGATFLEDTTISAKYDNHETKSGKTLDGPRAQLTSVQCLFLPATSIQSYCLKKQLFFWKYCHRLEIRMHIFTPQNVPIGPLLQMIDGWIVFPNCWRTVQQQHRSATSALINLLIKH